MNRISMVLGLMMTACGGAPFTFDSPLPADAAPEAVSEATEPDAQTLDAQAPDAQAPDARAIDARDDGAEANAPDASDASSPPDGCAPAPSATGTCGDGVTFHAPDAYCAVVYPGQDLSGPPATQVTMPTPEACRCVYDCACLFANLPQNGWCPPGTHYSQAVCGVKDGLLTLVCESDNDGG